MKPLLLFLASGLLIMGMSGCGRDESKSSAAPSSATRPDDPSRDPNFRNLPPAQQDAVKRAAGSSGG